MSDHDPFTIASAQMLLSTGDQRLGGNTSLIMLDRTPAKLTDLPEPD